MSGVVLILASGSDASSGIVLLSGGPVSIGASNRTATYRVGTDGYVYHGDNGAYTQQYQWLQNGGASSSYEVKADIVDGSVSGTTGSWVALSSNRDWSVTDFFSDGVDTSASITVQIRVAATLVVAATAGISLLASKT